jgi:hypothetical protein
MRTSSRGQAMVELVLGIIVFITVVMFGIHFAEVGYLSLKVHEAAVSPLWDATALRVHRMEPRPDNIGDFTPFPLIAPQVMANANARYRDFDGRSSSNGDPSITHVFTRVEDMRVQCEVEDRVEFDMPRSQRPGLRAPGSGGWGGGASDREPGNPRGSVLDGIYENVGGVACTAEAHLEGLPSLPESFLEGSTGFFQEKHSERLDMKACAAGRAVGGACLGRYAVLLGDFAFADEEVSGHCPLKPGQPDVPCEENPAYYYAARKVFDNNERSAGRAASSFAQFFVGYSPIDESGFFMSYRGVEDGYVEPNTPPGEPMDEAGRPRNTGGVEDQPNPRRRPSNVCFLGLRGC